MNKSWRFVLALLIALIASHSACGASSEDLYGDNLTLNIFGNANMDDLINAKDITYIEGILNGSKKQTDLADANQDGKVDQGDIDRIKQIIDGTESELYYVNPFGNTSKVKHPLKKIIIIYDNLAEIIRILGAEDRVVGIDTEQYQGAIGKYPRYFPEFQQKPSIGTRSDCDAEMILKLAPDAVISGVRGGCPEIEAKLEGSDIDIVRFESWSQGIPTLMMLAYMLDEVDNAMKYREWQNGYIDMVRDRVASIPLDKRPRVFFDRPGNTTYTRGSGISETLETAGGINIAADLTSSPRVDLGIASKNTMPPVDTEWVLEQNPDVIIGFSWDGGYEVDNISVLKTRYDEIQGTPGFSEINAGKNKKIFVNYFINTAGPGYQIGILYYAKWLYPELFRDLDPQKAHQEYIDKFQHVDFNLKEHGVFVYPPLNES